MADEYTPTTEDVRFNYVTGASDGMTYLEVYGDEFDRWLAAHDRDTAARAWDAAVRSMRYEDGTPVELVTNINPYREGDPT